MSTNFRRVLKYCRTLSGQSQLELALDAGMSARHLSFLESGRAEPGRDVVAKLAAALDIPDTARNALFVAAGFSPASKVAAKPPARVPRFERLLQISGPHPGALTDHRGTILATNAGMRALHAALTGMVIDLRGMAAAELAVGAGGFGPYLTNHEALMRRFAQCRTLERLVSGAPVDEVPAQTGTPAPREMIFDTEFGPLSFELIEATEGHRFHDQEHAVRLYGMLPSDRRTETAMVAMAARYEAAIASSNAA